jgi:hypothetical protein
MQHLKNCCTKDSFCILHCKKSVLSFQEYIHEGPNLKFYIPEFFNFELLIPEYSLIYRFWLQTAAYIFYSVCANHRRLTVSGP